MASLKYGDKGDAVKELQKRLKELGYFTGEIRGNYLSLTQEAVTTFQSQNGLVADGIYGPKTKAKLFSEEAKKYEIPKSTGKAGSTCEPAHGTAKKMDWWKSDIRKIFSKGTVATITDVKTGLSWREQRKGGTNHADCQPCTAADTAAFKKACKKWSWERRAIFVTIKGVNYAASMNCQPHGNGSIKNNNFPGHHCIHFTNSRTHCSNKVCPKHKKAIETAAKTTLP